MRARVADLYNDSAMLGRVRSNLARIEQLLEAPARQMRQVDGTAMGAPALESRMNDFGDEWSYGIGKLGEFSASAVEALDKIQESFRQADVALADALNEAKQ